MLGMRKAANWKDPNSVSNRMRSRRFQLFLELLQDAPRPVRLLDIGGTLDFWQNRGWADNPDFDVTVLNLMPQDSAFENLRVVVGDATDMHEFSDGAFDVAFSNSVIEHLFTYDAQKKMADETRRVAGAFWVQTPNYWFPMEPHFHMVGWQWLPESARIELIRRKRCGWRGPEPDRQKAAAAVKEVRLLTGREMRRLFPGAEVWGEKMYGLTKSWVAYGGFGKTIDETVSA